MNLFLNSEALLIRTHNMFLWRLEKYPYFWVENSTFNPSPAEPGFVLPLQTV